MGRHSKEYKDFIDEAYALEDDKTSSYNKEAIATLIKAMEELNLNIASEYNAIRIIRNNCNHAKEDSDIPPIDKIKDMLIRYIGHIRYAMKEASHGRN